MFEKSKDNDLELKENCDKRQFVEVMREWLQAIDRNQDFEVKVKGQLCRIPAEALEKGRFRLEYEIDKGEYEFELTLKWR
jgi:hypothetical protein